MSVYVRACMRACVRARLRMCVCVCVRARARACVLMYALRIVSLDTEALALYEYFKLFIYILLLLLCDVCSIRAQKLCESRGGHPGLTVPSISLMVSVDVKQH